MNYLYDNQTFSENMPTKLREKMGYSLQKSWSSNNNVSSGSVIETDYLNGMTEEQTQTLRDKGILACTDDLAMCQTDLYPSYGSAEDVIEESVWHQVSAKICDELRQSSRKINLEVFVPTNLMERISKDVVRMSGCEPCGLRGCVIHLKLEQRSCVSHKMGVVQLDLNTVPTFELHLTLVQDKKRWYSLRDLIIPIMSGCFQETLTEEVYISPGYTIVKNKLYRLS